MNELMENLENGVPPIQLCLHMRDFQAGKSIASNIIDEGIMGSRKIIVVVSQHFIDSAWCRFEFELAQSRFMMERNANIIIIILEDVEERKTKNVLGLHKHLKKNTYLKWSRDPLTAERTEKQKQLGAKLMTSQQKIEERIKKWQDLRQAVASLKHSSQNVLDENERIFAELLKALERRHGEVKEMIRAQETLLLTRAEGHLARLEEEITLLRKKHTDLEQLSQSDDHIHFLQSWQSLSAPSGYEDLSKVTLAPHHTFDNAKKAIFDLKVQLEDISKEELNKISSAVKEVKILQTLDPAKREELLEYSCQLSMDSSTAHPNLHLSNRNTVVRMSNEPKSYPEHPDRFEYWQQVLFCGLSEGLTKVGDASAVPYHRGEGMIFKISQCEVMQQV
ncbi:hypothetical protein Q8A67_011005 [Cirrhinus molitorella]|uniref:TIR domain-containing protein n=1 Tax=Cirrhinus molitorella TaxID=172907 RepID=A0AA88Q1N1_9TELE|nr:hypothetical protein Q8A67_011005 [Cirrhinus molitorella]